MEGVFFVKAGTFIHENMMPCSYGTYEENELKAMYVRLQEKEQNHTDLYFLKNLGVLLSVHGKIGWIKKGKIV